MIRIMVDSAADCGKKAYDLYVPLRVCFGGMEFRDGVDLTANRFYMLLTEAGNFPRPRSPRRRIFSSNFRRPWTPEMKLSTFRFPLP